MDKFKIWLALDRARCLLEMPLHLNWGNWKTIYDNLQ